MMLRLPRRCARRRRHAWRETWARDEIKARSEGRMRLSYTRRIPSAAVAKHARPRTGRQHALGPDPPARTLVRGDRDVVELQPGIAVRPQAGVDDEARARTGIHGDPDPRVVTYRAERALADDLATGRAQAEVAVGGVPRRPDPATDLVDPVRHDRDRLVDVVPVRVAADPRVTGAGVRERGVVGAAVVRAPPRAEARRLEVRIGDDVRPEWCGRGRLQRRQHARSRVR